jgi:hypothetical protein
MLAAVALTLAATAAGPPAETLSRAQCAFDLLAGHGFTGTYAMTAQVKVSATGEDGPENTLEIHQVTVDGKGGKVSRLVMAMEDGHDVTAERLSKGEGERRSQEPGGGSVRFELLPLGDNMDRHVFAAPRRQDGLLVSKYTPRRNRKVDGEMLSRGEIAWDPATGDPRWIELRPADEPPFVKELTLRFEFARAGEVVYPSRVHTRTRAGIPLLFKLRLELDIAFSDLLPAR